MIFRSAPVTCSHVAAEISPSARTSLSTPISIRELCWNNCLPFPASVNVMAFVSEKGAEPIPGYVLVERLGVGGFGEVWKASAPGGLAKAIKIIYGKLGDRWAEQ